MDLQFGNWRKVQNYIIISNFYYVFGVSNDLILSLYVIFDFNFIQNVKLEY